MRINKIYLLGYIGCVVCNDNDISHNMTLINGCISCVDNNECMVSGHMVTHLYKHSKFQRLVYLNLPETEENSSFDADINRYRYH